MKSGQQLKILLACGGSGGHLIPGLVVREELVKRGHTVFLSVSDKQIDAEILLRNHLEAALVLKANTSGLPAPLRALRTAWDFAACTLKARSFIKSRGVNFVLGMGGFNCAAPLFAAGLTRVPRALHESNAIPGKVTRLFQKSLDAIFIGFEQCRGHLRQAKNVQFTGTPRRHKNNGLAKKGTKQNYLAHGLDPEKKTILLLGGSQGSEFLNKLLANSATIFAPHRDKIQFIHISGKPQPALEIHPMDDLGVTRKHYSYYNDMDELYALADVIVARSGSGVISEILELQKKAILVPLPTAADNHQWHNARAVESPGTIEILEQKDASPSRLMEKIFNLLKTPDGQAGKTANPPARRAELTIAENIEKIASQKQKKS